MTRSMVADWAGALAAFREALTLARHLGDPDLLIYVVHGIAAVAGLTGDPERSARLFGAAARLREEVGIELPSSHRGLVETTQGMVRQAMAEPEAFDRWFEQSQALTLDATLDLARHCLDDTRTRLVTDESGDATHPEPPAGG